MAPDETREDTPKVRDIIAARSSLDAQAALERTTDLRPSRVGRVADAVRQAAFQLDDSSVRPRSVQRLPRQPSEEGSLGRNPRRTRYRHHVSGTFEVRSADAQ